MQQFKNYNNISKTLEQAQRKLLPGESATFQMLTGIKNVDPDPIEVEKRPMLYGIVHIPTRTTIRDPETKKPVDIAWLRIAENDTPVFPIFHAGINMPNYRFNGRFTLNGDNPEHQEILDVISISNENKRFAFRDPTKEPLFYEIIPVEESQNKMTKIEALRKALNKAEELSLDEVRDIAAALGFNYNSEPVIVKETVTTYAQNEPETFLSLFDDALTPIKSDVMKALQEGILAFDNSNGQMKMGAIVLTTLSGYGNVDFDHTLRFSEWINSSTEGKSKLKAIKAQLKNKQETAV